MTADDVVSLLDLAPHPEGGWYRQTWVAEGPGRPVGTCIYFLLKAGERSHWHRVDATEIWHHYRGAALTMRIALEEKGPAQSYRLGSDLRAHERPQIIVPTGAWQSAENNAGADWTLVGCTVSPGFQFKGFELAAPDFDIPVG